MDMGSFGDVETLRIAIVCPYYPWPPSIGGVETIVRDVSTELAKRSHEVHVVTTPFDVTSMKQVLNYGVEKRGKIIIHKLKPGKLRIGYARLLKGLRNVISETRPNIIHSHNLQPHLFQLARWKKKFQYNLIAELHHPAVELDFTIQKMAFPFVVKALIPTSKNIDAFLAHTNLEQKWLVQGVDKKTSIYIIRFPAILPELLNYKLKEYDGMRDLIFLGRVVHRKGLHILIKALSSLCKSDTRGNITLTIAGPGDYKYVSYLRRLINDLDLTNNTIIMERVIGQEKYKLISSHKALVLPSLKEFTPSVLLEAQALGVPVIATRVGAVPEMMVDGETGLLVKPGEEHELSKAIELLLRNEKLRGGFSIKAREFARNLTIDKAVDKLEELYYALINGSN